VRKRLGTYAGDIILSINIDSTKPIKPLKTERLKQRYTVRGVLGKTSAMQGVLVRLSVVRLEGLLYHNERKVSVRQSRAVSIDASSMSTFIC